MLKVFSSVLNQELRKTFSYRANFWMQFFGQTVGEIAIAFFLWRAVFEYTQTATIGGYTFHQMLTYYVLMALSVRIIRGKESYSVSTDIYDGGLTRYLIYPAPYLLFKLAEHLAHVAITVVQFFIGLAISSLVFVPIRELLMNPAAILMGLAAAFIASLLYFIIQFLLEMVAFWADNIWSLNVMLRFVVGFLGGMVLPLSLFPKWAQDLIAMTPFPAMASMPVQLMSGKLGYEVYLSALPIVLLWALPISLMCFYVWRRGVYQFTGVGQ